MYSDWKEREKKKNIDFLLCRIRIIEILPKGSITEALKLREVALAILGKENILNS